MGDRAPDNRARARSGSRSAALGSFQLAALVFAVFADGVAAEKSRQVVKKVQVLRIGEPMESLPTDVVEGGRRTTHPNTIGVTIPEKSKHATKAQMKTSKLKPETSVAGRHLGGLNAMLRGAVAGGGAPLILGVQNVTDGREEGGEVDPEDEPPKQGQLRMNVILHVDSEEDRSQSSGTRRVLRVWSNRTHCLNFMHIPKTGGSSIEAIGHGAGKNWGREAELRCSTQQKCPDGLPWGGHARCCKMPDDSACSVWHVPPALDDTLQQSYAECDTFCVVRDPASRFRSQHVWSGGGCSTEALSEATQAKLEEQLQIHPYQDDCHLVPQSQFIRSTAGGNEYCQHTLRLEHLAEDFTSLVEKYGIDATLSVHANPSSCAAEFDEASKLRIKKFYKEDYEAFGYSDT